jgi:hypothetical protein
MVMITATMKVKIKGILLQVGVEEILAAINKQMPSINGMETDAATKAANGLGLKSKYWPLENGRVNIKTIPTATIKNTANPTMRDSFINFAAMTTIVAINPN